MRLTKYTISGSRYLQGRRTVISIEIGGNGIDFQWINFNLFYIEKRKEVHKPGKFDAAPGIEWLSGNSSDVG